MTFINRIVNLLIALLLTGSATSFAQSPGGIENPVIWEKTWTSDSQKLLEDSKFNYNPYQYFSEVGVYKEFKLKDLDQFSMFVVFNTESSAQVGKLENGEQEVVWSGEMLVAKKEFKLEKYSNPQMLTFISAFPNQNVGTESSQFLIGSKNKSIQAFAGGVSELVVYDKVIGRKDKNRIESYLSIKYGLSLPMESNYYNSEGEAIRIAVDHDLFNHRVTMIGRDDGSDLYQRQSHNLYDNLNLTIALKEVANSNELNAGRLNDQSFLMWADDNADLDFSDNEISSQLSRKWELKGLGIDIQNKKIEVRIDPSVMKNFSKKENLYLVLSSDSNFSDLSENNYFLMEPILENSYAAKADLKTLKTDRLYMSFVQSKFESWSDTNSDGLNPNPVIHGDYFQISVENIEDSKLEIQIIDAQGKQVKSESVTVDGDLFITERILYPGLYFIHVKGDKTDLSYKLIVQ